ncbi:HlyD family efflux transporter periplasmic adaptor subunit [Puteibacter caeruleilacunae]|nr:HlyD family efflux transporter periplasmic adaptor subunit [Puteibacter caeruleilacunae]
MKFINVQMCVLLLLVFVQCKNKEQRVTSKVVTATEFNTQKVCLSTVNSIVNVTGRVIPSEKVSIVSEVQGIVLSSKRNFDDGERYRKGELLIAINDTEFRYQLKAQKNDFINVLAKTMSDIDLDYPDEYPRWESFLSNIAIDQNLPELPETKDSQLRFFLSSRNVYKAYYNIKSKEERLSKFRLYAPFDGSVIKAHIDQGDLVKPGAQLGEFIGTNEYEVQIGVSPKDIGVVNIGGTISLYASSIDKYFTATVKRISENLNSKTQSINVYLGIKDDSLRAGMYLEGKLTVASWDKAVRIPKNLVTRDNKAYVITNNVVSTKRVTVLSYEEDTVVINGLDDGDILIAEQVRPQQIGHKAESKQS